jgi:hypothetical protein
MRTSAAPFRKERKNMTVVVSWPGKSGTQYRTELFPMGTKFNAVSGVYIACKAAATPGRWTSLYDRLNTNVAAHNGLVCAARRGATHIAVVRANGDAERLRIETDLRHGLNPPCNQQPVPARVPAKQAY